MKEKDQIRLRQTQPAVQMEMEVLKALLLALSRRHIPDQLVVEALLQFQIKFINVFTVGSFFQTKRYIFCTKVVTRIPTLGDAIFAENFATMFTTSIHIY